MRFKQNGKTIFIDGYAFNEVDKKPEINDIYVNSFGYKFKITDVINRYNKNCFSVVIDNEDFIDVYYGI
jgi:hypothetical protein